MKSLKKFIAFTIATAIVASSVWAVTPALKALADAANGYRVKYYAETGYVEDPAGPYWWSSDTGYVQYDNQDQSADTTVPVTGINLPDNISITLGETKVIDVTVVPATASKDLTFSTGAGAHDIFDMSYSSETGKLTIEAIGVGTGTLTATAPNDSSDENDDVSKTITIKVVNSSPTSTDKPTLTLSFKETKLYVGGLTSVRATVKPATSGYYPNQIIWTASDSSIARFSPNYDLASIFALKPGTMTVTAKLVDSAGDVLATATCKITISGEASKQNAGGGDDSSSSSAADVIVETILPANITTADGKPISMFTSTDGSKTMMAGAVGLIPSGAKLQAVEAAPTSQTFTVATAIMAIWRPNAEVKKVYDFNVFSKQAQVIKTLDGKICMSIPVPADLVVPPDMVLKVYKFNDDGTITICETLIDQGRVVWGTDSFGTFAFVVEKPAKPAKSARR